MSAIPNLPEDIVKGEDTSSDAALRHLLSSRNDAANTGDAQTDGATYVNGAAADAPWLLHQAPVENQRPLKVIVIGAGYSGIYLGIRLPERLKNCEIVIYEKNAGTGGTWYAALRSNCRTS